ncbi:hypothetical protein RJ641_019693 [Dillenia turbinata]|uniref:Pentatricopeptide repeat-containing protein n=1 Tax=Dillenia turbinata TaxID=194707 RepID=A0AAN8YXR8_9MAGN
MNWSTIGRPADIVKLQIHGGHWNGRMRNRSMGIIRMRDRSKNRKPLQRGRCLSIEAIQSVQALKRSFFSNSNSHNLDAVLTHNFRRLVKRDMTAVLSELLRQNHCFLALKVFEELRKEDWYKPQVSLYAHIIETLVGNGFSKEVEQLFMYLRTENMLEPDSEGFNTLLKILIGFDRTGLAMECYYFMKESRCEPDKSSFMLLVNGLESKGETGLSVTVRQEGKKIFGEFIDFTDLEEMSVAES